MPPDYGKAAGLRYAGRRKYGEKNTIAMIGGRHIFTPTFFFTGRDIHGITLGKRSEGKMSCFT